MIVVDTNIIAYLYIYGAHSRHSEKLLSVDPEWVAPVLWRSEFRSVLAQYLRKEQLTLDDVLLIMRQAEELMAGYEYKISSEPVMQLVRSSACSAYDCEFIALSHYLDVPLITTDKKIIRNFPGTAITVDAYIRK